MKRTILSLLITLSFSAQSIEINIGKKAEFDPNETRVFTGGGAPQNNSAPIIAPQAQSVEEVLNSSDVKFYRGGQSGRQIAKPIQNPSQTVENNIKENMSFSFTNPFTGFAKETPIPTNFSLLGQDLGRPSGAPMGLPEFKELGTLSDKDLPNVSRESAITANRNNAKLLVKNAHKDLQSLNSSVSNEWVYLFERESKLMMASGAPMRIVIIPNDQHVMYDFMRTTLAKGSEKRLQELKNGKGVYSLLGYPSVSGVVMPVCYMVMDKDFKNISNASHLFGNKEAVASVFVGQMAGKCLDQLERDQKLKQINTLFATEAPSVGILPSVFKKVYPLGMKRGQSLDEIWTEPQKMVQRQIADSFGVMWAYNRGYKNIWDAFYQYQTRDPSYVINSLSMTKQKLVYMKTNTLTLSQVWKIAREIQTVFIKNYQEKPDTNKNTEGNKKNK